VFFQGVRQREAVIDDDILRGKCCFGEMQTVIARINADLITVSTNLHLTLMYKQFIVFHDYSPMQRFLIIRLLQIVNRNWQKTGKRKLLRYNEQ